MIIFKYNDTAKKLYLIIIIMFFPIFISSKLLGNFGYQTILYAISYSVCIIIFMSIKKKKQVIISKTDLILFIGYLIILSITVSFSIFSNKFFQYYDIINSIIKLINFYAFYILAKSLICDYEEILYFFKYIVITGLITIILAVLIDYRIILAIPNTSNTNLINIMGVFSNRNQFGSFLLFAIISNSIISETNLKFKYSLFIDLFLFIFIILTFSRGALLAALVFKFTLIFLKKGSLKFYLSFFIIVISVIGFSIGLFNKFFDSLIRVDGFDSGRFELWMYAFDIIKKNPLIGVGYYTGIEMANMSGMVHTQFHNMFLDLLVSGGILELIFICILFFKIIYKLIYFNNKSKFSKIYLVSFFVFFIRAMIESLSVLGLGYSDTIYTILYITIPTILIYNKNKERISLIHEKI